MTFRNRPSTTVVRRSKRMTDWALVAFPATLIAVPANSKVLVASFTAASLATLAPFTIVRTRGYFSISSDQVAASEDQLGAFGLALINETARALGVTGIPGPSFDSTWDAWFFHQYFGEHLQVGSNVGLEPAFAKTFPIDSKAMRKVEGDQGLALMVENTHATHGFNISVGLRILIKAG